MCQKWKWMTDWTTCSTGKADKPLDTDPTYLWAGASAEGQEIQSTSRKRPLNWVALPYMLSAWESYSRYWWIESYFVQDYWRLQDWRGHAWKYAIAQGKAGRVLYWQNTLTPWHTSFQEQLQGLSSNLDRLNAAPTPAPSMAPSCNSWWQTDRQSRLMSFHISFNPEIPRPCARAVRTATGTWGFSVVKRQNTQAFGHPSCILLLSVSFVATCGCCDSQCIVVVVVVGYSMQSPFAKPGMLWPSGYFWSTHRSAERGNVAATASRCVKKKISKFMTFWTLNFMTKLRQIHVRHDAKVRYIACRCSRWDAQDDRPTDSWAESWVSLGDFLVDATRFQVAFLNFSKFVEHLCACSGFWRLLPSMDWLKFEQNKFSKQLRGDHLLKLTGENYSGGEFLMTKTGV